MATIIGQVTTLAILANKSSPIAKLIFNLIAAHKNRDFLYSKFKRYKTLFLKKFWLALVGQFYVRDLSCFGTHLLLNFTTLANA